MLLDQETGFGVQPLREHVRACQDCRTRLDAAEGLASRLSELPLIAPRFGLADRVMSQVPVFVPWHVAARDSLLRLAPTGRGTQLVAAALVGVVGSLVTGVTLWVATRGDLISMLTGLAGESAKNAASDAAGDAVVALLGPQAVAAVQQIGPLGIALAAGGFVVASLGTVMGLRLVATSSRARS